MDGASPNSADPVSTAATQGGVLPYASDVTRYGITLVCTDDETRVVVPRIRGWRIAWRWPWLVAAIFGVRVIAATDEGVVPLTSAGIFVGLVVYGAVTTVLRRAFVVNPAEVRVGYVRGDTLMWSESWPRHAVGEIRVNLSNGKLLVRITGQDLKEYFISSDREVTRIVAETLAAALRDHQ